MRVGCEKSVVRVWDESVCVIIEVGSIILSYVKYASGEFYKNETPKTARNRGIFSLSYCQNAYVGLLPYEPLRQNIKGERF